MSKNIINSFFIVESFEKFVHKNYNRKKKKNGHWCEIKIGIEYVHNKHENPLQKKLKKKFEKRQKKLNLCRNHSNEFHWRSFYFLVSSIIWDFSKQKSLFLPKLVFLLIWFLNLALSKLHFLQKWLYLFDFRWTCWFWLVLKKNFCFCYF